MTPHDDLGEHAASWPPGGDIAHVEHHIRQFEEAWANGKRPQIEQYLASNSNNGLLLVELVHADLEFRLRAAEPVRVEEYLAKFPSLA